MDYVGLSDNIWNIIEYHIPKTKRSRVAKELIELFEIQGQDMHGTELWRQAYKPCPVCNHNNDATAFEINKCKHCGGKGEILRHREGRGR